MLLASSLIFYAFWDWRFLFLLGFSIGLDYLSGIQIAKSNSQKRKKTWLILSIGINLVFLGFFKYFNFFIGSFAETLQFMGFKANIPVLNILLPVGISFYTFHGLSYVIDIYKDRIPAERNIIQYSLFVSYFPLLVAGPIERATHLLPQLKVQRSFNYGQAVNGCRQILWGFFKKVVIADNCAEYVNVIFADYSTLSSTTLMLGAILFAFQIYGDFSGYSDIAQGVSRLLGIELLKNFSFPYFADSISEFWKRWHISLSSWFRDYVYIPLGGSRNGKLMQLRNVMIIFMISGFWHGANFTFIAWGTIHGLLFIPSIWMPRNQKPLFSYNFLNIGHKAFKIVCTFLIVSIAWIFFRAKTIGKAFDYIHHICTQNIDTPRMVPTIVFLLIAIMLLVEWFGQKNDYALQTMKFAPFRIFRWTCYTFILSIILLYMQTKETPFIYFQF